MKHQDNQLETPAKESLLSRDSELREEGTMGAT